MILHTNQIPPEGKHLEGEEPAGILDLNEPGFRPAGPIRYALDVGLSGGGLFATGQLALPAEMECVRCLRPFTREIAVEAFAMQTELEGAETVDLTPYIREDILLALPAHPHCDWDGKASCPGLRHVLPETAEEAGGMETGRPDAWEALDRLDLGEAGEEKERDKRGES